MRESRLWLLHILTGAFLLFLLGFHILLMHLNGVMLFMGYSVGDVLAFEEVAQRGRQVGHFLIYLGLLLFALFHGFYGLRSMLYELNLKRVGERIVSWVLILLGIGLFIFGTYSTWAMLKG